MACFTRQGGFLGGEKDGVRWCTGRLVKQFHSIKTYQQIYYGYKNINANFKLSSNDEKPILHHSIQVRRKPTAYSASNNAFMRISGGCVNSDSFLSSVAKIWDHFFPWQISFSPCSTEHQHVPLPQLLITCLNRPDPRQIRYPTAF